MSADGMSKIITHGDIEDSQTTIEIKIKTLDSQTYTLRVNKCVPVPLLREKIANVTGIVSEQQRLICRGKVLKDDELLSAYHVEDGHTLHLVVRQVQQSSSPAPGYMAHEGLSNHPASNGSSSAARHHGNTVARSIVFEAVNTDQGAHDVPNLSQIISSILNFFGTVNVGSNNSRTDVMSTRTSDDTGRSDSTQTNRTPTSARAEVDSQRVPFLVHAESQLGSPQPTIIPDSLATILQYLEFMKEEFRRAGFNFNGRDRADNDVQTARNHSNEAQNDDYISHSAFRQGGPLSTASLAEVMLSVRQLLTEQAGECLSHLAGQLEGNGNITDPSVRMNLQSSAIRSGVLLQNLGSLLLELGRATMMLRIGQAPSEALINAGPAVFISASGPNPLMVQPVPFFAGSSFGHMGSIYSGNGLQAESLGSLLRPRNLDIHIRTGRGAPVVTSSPGEQTGAQAQEPTDTTRDSLGASLSHQAFSMLTGTAPATGESGVRVLPIRTVVAVPAGVTRSLPDSGSGVGLIYPLLVPLQQVNTQSARDGRVPQTPNESSHGGSVTSQRSNLEPSRIAEDSGFFNGGQQGLPISGSNTNSQDHMSQQNGQDLISQALNSFSRWFGSIFSGHQPGANGTNRQDSITASDQIGTAIDIDGSRNNNNNSSSLQTLRENRNDSRVNLNASTGSQHACDGIEGSNSMSPRTASGSLIDSRVNLNEASSSDHVHDPIEDPIPKRRRKSE